MIVWVEFILTLTSIQESLESNLFKKKKMSQAEKHRGWIRMRNLSNVKIAIQVQIILTARNEQRYLGFAVLLNVPPLKLKQHIFLFAKRKEKAPKGKVYFESPASPQSLSTGKKTKRSFLEKSQNICAGHVQHPQTMLQVFPLQK